MPRETEDHDFFTGKCPTCGQANALRAVAAAVRDGTYKRWTE